jgi:purine nucleosidase
MNHLTKLLVDTDSGPGKSLAVLCAAGSGRAVLEGITTVFGGAKASKTADHALRLAALAGRPISGAAGAERPLLREWVPSEPENGEAGCVLPEVGRQLERMTGADLIVGMANRYPGELTVVCLGPLTNVALALVKDPGLAGKVKRLVIAGGSLKAPGDVTPVSERNMMLDPDAAFRVFHSGMPITMLGLDVLRQAVVPGDRLQSVTDAAKEADTPAAEVVRQLLDDLIAASGGGGVPLAEVFAVAASVEPELAATEPYAITVETKGSLSLGATLTDLRQGAERKINCEVAMNVDRDQLVDRLIEWLTATAKGGAR